MQTRGGRWGSWAGAPLVHTTLMTKPAPPLIAQCSGDCFNPSTRECGHRSRQALGRPGHDGVQGKVDSGWKPLQLHTLHQASSGMARRV